MLRYDSSAGAGAGPGAALQRTPLVLAHSAPDTGILAAVQCPRQAAGCDRATSANRLGLADLQERGTAVPNREEQLGVLVTAGRAVAPVHCSLLLARRAPAHHSSCVGRRGACEWFHEPRRCQELCLKPVRELTQKIDVGLTCGYAWLFETRPRSHSGLGQITYRSHRDPECGWH